MTMKTMDVTTAELATSPTTTALFVHCTPRRQLAIEMMIP